MKITVILVFLVILVVAITYCLITKHKKVVLALSIILCTAVILILLYCFNLPFKNCVNIYCNPAKNHRYIIGDDVDYLPLPPKTAMKYRTSDSSAVYKSKSSADEIIAFFQVVSDAETVSKNECDNVIVLTFEYKKTKFSVSVNKNSAEFSIDVLFS